MTINCAERGLLLLRIRDELKMTLAAYQTLYQSSIAFGMRKALQVCTVFFLIHKKICIKKCYNFDMVFKGWTRKRRFNCCCRWATITEGWIRKNSYWIKTEIWTGWKESSWTTGSWRKKAHGRNTIFEKDKSAIESNIYIQFLYES